MEQGNSMPETALYFEDIYKHARQNAILIMNGEGIIQKVNDAFTAAYGYTTEDLASKHLRVLFTEKDQATKKPEIELNQTHREGAGNDENYLVHKNGTLVWVGGESLLVRGTDHTCIVKVIHNIHAQKQLERYLLSSTELLDSIFESVPQSGLLVLNSQMKAVKANSTFVRMFSLEETVPNGAKLQEIKHDFWQQDDLKNEIRNALVNGVKIDKEFVADHGNKTATRFHITSELMISDDMTDKTLLLILKEI